MGVEFPRGFQQVERILRVGVDVGSRQCGHGVDGVASGGFAGGVDPFGVHPVGELSAVVGDDVSQCGDAFGVGGGRASRRDGVVEVPVVGIDQGGVEVVAALFGEGDVGQGAVGGLAHAAPQP